MKRIIIFLLTMALLSVQVCAVDTSEQGRALEDALPDTAEELMGDFDFGNTSSFGVKILDILQSAWGYCKTHFTTSVRNVTVMVLIVLLSATIGALCPDTALHAVSLCGTAGILILCAGGVHSMFKIATTTIADVHAFSKMLLPIMTAACFSTGMPTASAALYSGTMLFMQVLLALLEHILLPLVYAYIALTGADAALNADTLGQFRKFIGSTVKTILKVVMFLFSAYLSLTGVITGRADALALKAAKLTVSSAVPVVGGMVSDASEAVLIGAKTLLNSAGVFGMLGALAILIVPFLQIGIQYLALQIGTAISSLLGTKCHIKLLEGISSAMGYLLAITSCSTLMIFISCFCFMRVSAV